MDTKILEEIGLTHGEIKTYLALLTLGSSSTGPIAKESGVSRSKLYMILDKLEKKGLVSHIEKDGIVYFQSVEPQKIKDYLIKKENGLKTLKKRFDNFLPQLESYYEKPGAVQKISVYQGMKGLDSAHEHVYKKLKVGEEYVCVGIPKQPRELHTFWHKDHLRRIRAGIKCKLLFSQDELPNVLRDRNRYEGCDARYMPIKINTPSYFYVFKDTVIISIPSEKPLVIEIISQEIADSFMAYFKEFWKKSKPFRG